MARGIGQLVRIAVINGPNLNLLGQREPAIYGKTTLAQIESRLREVAKELDVALSFSQFNGEGDIIDRRYRVLRITPVSVEVEDVLSNNRQSIPLTQG